MSNNIIENKYNYFISNDGMYIEEGMAWFIGNKDHILYKMNVIDMKVIPIAVLSNNSNGFRLFSKCVKFNNIVCCLPDNDKHIAFYNLSDNSINYIPVENPLGVRISIFDAWINGFTLWCVSYGLNQIIEVNLQTQTIDNYFNIFESKNDMVGYQSTKVDNMIFGVSRTSNMLFSFNIELKEKYIYTLPLNEKGLNTIVFDGFNFWFTGYNMQIYCWNKESNNIQIISDFPKDYSKSCKHPLFYKSFAIRDKILFVPWIFPEDASKCIIIVNKNTKELGSFPFTMKEKKGNYITVEFFHEESLLTIHHWYYQYIEELNIDEITITQRKMLPNEEQTIEFLKNNKERIEFIMESGSCSIESFCKYLYEI